MKAIQAIKGIKANEFQRFPPWQPVPNRFPWQPCGSLAVGKRPIFNNFDFQVYLLTSFNFPKVYD